MNFLIMGAGAVGAYVGARLAEVNHNVGFVARGSHLEALKKNGLEIQSGNGDLTLGNIKVNDDPTAFQSPDVIIFCVKLWDTKKAATSCLPIIKKDTAVLTLQNGVESVNVLSNIIGRKHILGGTIYIACEIFKPGVIKHFGHKSHIIFGENFQTTSNRTTEIKAAFANTSIETTLSKNISKVIWEKYIALVALSGATSITRLPIRTLMTNPTTVALINNLMNETLLLAKTKGINISKTIIKKHRDFFESVSPEMTSSMLQDLRNGRRLELDWLAGGVVRMARQTGIKVPTNETVLAAIELYKNGLPILVE